VTIANYFHLQSLIARKDLVLVTWSLLNFGLSIIVRFYCKIVYCFSRMMH